MAPFSRQVSRALLGLWCPGVLFAQAADIHPSPPNTIAEMRVRFTAGRYELRNATAVDLIRTAWNVSADNVAGGPDWLDADRFDVIAPVPTSANAEMLRGRLQELLKLRFHLSVHNGEREEPAYEITAGKKPVLKTADGSEPSGCRPQLQQGQSSAGGAQWVTLECRNVTMASLAKVLPTIREASGYLFNYPVVDRTALAGAWDFTLQWHVRRALLQAPVTGEITTIFDAFEKLGLKLTRTKVANPVIVVDHIEKPSPNPPGITEERRLRPEFEVAEIKPDPDHHQCSSVRIDPGGRVRINMTLPGLILETQGETNTHRVVGGPKSIDDHCFVIQAKGPAQSDAPAGWNGPVWNGMDIDSMRAMLRALLEDRFQLKAHTEEQLVSGHALVAARPKLRRADPSNRPGCKEGPGPDGKDPRLTNPLASRLVTCRNMTLAQFASELNNMGCGCAPVTDATGLAGRYDLTVNFSPPTAFPRPGELAAGPEVANDPTGAISIFEALPKQLGLKLQSRQVRTPVLVIDHINEQPSEN
jgi:uncharacterized protein (TIGR03435 family)